MRTSTSGSGPLLPTHASAYGVKTGPGRSKRRGSTAFRLVVICIVLGSVAYASFAFMYVRKSARVDARWARQPRGPQVADEEPARRHVEVADEHTLKIPAMHEATQDMLHTHDKHDKQQEAHSNSVTVGGGEGEIAGQRASVDQLPAAGSQHPVQTRTQPTDTQSKQADKAEPQTASSSPTTTQTQRVLVAQEPTVPVASPADQGVYSLSAKDIDGHETPLSLYAGNISLVVNVASACGYTDSNYKGLQATYEKYKAHGFNVLGFPCNQFGKQEPGTEAEVKAFCTSHFHVTFPMFSKLEVNGPLTHPVYQYLKSHLPPTEGQGQDLGWNFYKILVDRNGKPVKRFDQMWDASAVETAIYQLLQPPAAA